MKKLFSLVAFAITLFFFGPPAFGAITRTGQCNAATTSCTLSAVNSGDLVLTFAFRNGSNTVPGADGSNTSVTTIQAGSGGTTASARVSCRKASSGSDTSSGTYSNATHVVSVAFSGTSIGTTGNCNTTSIGGSNQGSAKTSTTVTYAAISSFTHSSDSWVAAFMGGTASSGTIICSPTSPQTLTAESSASNARLSDSEGAFTSWAAETCTVSSETWVSWEGEILSPITNTRSTTDNLQMFDVGARSKGNSRSATDATTPAPAYVSFPIGNPGPVTSVAIGTDFSNTGFSIAVAGIGQIVPSVTVWLAQFNANNNLAVKVYYCTAGATFGNYIPTGSALATSSSINENTFPVFSDLSSLQPFTFTFSPAFRMIEGTAYCFTVEDASVPSGAGLLVGVANLAVNVSPYFGGINNGSWSDSNGGAIAQLSILLNAYMPGGNDNATRIVGNSRTSVDAAVVQEKSARIFSGIRPFADALSVPAGVDKTYAYPQSVRTKFTVNTGMVPSTQTNFPALVTGCDDRFKTIAKGGRVQESHGYDLRPYSDAALTIPLSFELVDYNSSTGCFQMWVLMPSIADGTSFWMKYDDPSISSDGTNLSAVWSANGYKLVYHHEQASGANAPDSSGNGNTATVAAGSPTSVAAKIENGISVSGSDWFTTSRSAFGTNSALTFGGWFNPSVIKSGNFAFSKDDVSGNDDFTLRQPSSVDEWVVEVINASGTFGKVEGGVALSTGTWYYVIGTYDGANVKLYVNGAAQGSPTALTGNVRDTSTATINQGVDLNSSGWQGKFDETRIASVAWSADWIAAEYNNQLSPTTFWTMGNEGVTYARRDAQHVTWDSVQIISDIATAIKMAGGTNFPRSAVEQVVGAEIASRIFSGTRPVVDVVPSAESVTRIFNAVRPVTEGGVTSETPLRVFNAIRALAEGGFVREFGVRALTMARTGADAGTAYEYNARVASNVRAAKEGGFTLEYNSQRLFSGSRTGADSTGTRENGQRLLTMARTATETGLVNEYGVRVASNVRLVFEGGTTSENIARLFSGARLVFEGGFISDISTRQVNAGRTDYTRIGGDASANFEFAARTLTMARTGADSSTVSDSGARLATMARLSTDMFSASDLGTRAAGATRSVFEASNLADVGRRVFSGFRTVVEVVSTSDAGIRTQSSFRSATDSSGSSDFATRSKGAIRSATDSAVLFDSSTRFFAGSRAAVESIILADNGLRLSGLHRSSIDLFATSDLSTRTVNMVRHYTEDMADAISVFESPRANRIAWNPSLAHIFTVSPRITQWVFNPRPTRFIMTPRVYEWDLSQRQTQFHLSPRVTQFIYQR